MNLLLRLLLALAASFALAAPSARAAETASGRFGASANEEHTYFVGELGAWVHNGSPINVNAIPSDPQSLWGKSAAEIATAYTEAGYTANVRGSNRGSAAEIVEIGGHSVVTQIMVHPGGGRHEGAYVKISTSTAGTIKVVDPSTYKPTPGEKATIVARTLECPK